MIPDRIMARVEIEEETGCWLWLGWTTKSGSPQIGWKGKVASGRKVAWELTHGPVPEGKLCACPCEDQRCINPDHIRVVSRKGLAALNRKRGKLKLSAIARAKIAARMRANGKLDWQKVRHIRTCQDRCQDLAERYGVCVTTIERVRQGKYWPEPGLASMLAQLRWQ